MVTSAMHTPLPEMVCTRERPTAMVAYEKDMTAATTDSHQSSWKFGSWLKMHCTVPKAMMYELVFWVQLASCPCQWKQFDLRIALRASQNR